MSRSHRSISEKCKHHHRNGGWKNSSSSGSEFHRRRHCSQFNGELEELPISESMKFRHRDYSFGKEWNWDIGVLNRYLRHHIGRRWNDVYSDLRHEFSDNSAKTHWILETLNNNVLKNTFYGEDGNIYVNMDRSFPCFDGVVEIVRSGTEFYVSPDGILCHLDEKKRIKRERPRFLVEKNGKKFVKKDSIWYEVEMKVPETPVGGWSYKNSGATFYDNLLKMEINHYSMLSYYGKCWYVISKKQISGEDITRYGLREMNIPDIPSKVE